MKPLSYRDRGAISAMAFVFLLHMNGFLLTPMPGWIAVIFGLINACIWWYITGNWRKEDK